MFFDLPPLFGEPRSGSGADPHGPGYSIEFVKSIGVHVETTRAARARR
jgi:hypothetical protein